MFQGINSIEFNRQFKNNEDFYLYLIEKKWGNGFRCSRCGCEECYKGKTYYHRRCKACRYGGTVIPYDT
jgi:two-component system, sensor histidine kinase LadS